MDLNEITTFPAIELAHRRTEKPNVNDFRMHTHTRMELYYFIEGHASYRVEGTTYPLEQGDILIMESGEAHSLLIYPEQPYERITIHFSPQILNEANRYLLQAFTDRPLGKWNRQSSRMLSSCPIRPCLERMFAYGKQQDLEGVRAYFIPLLKEIHSNWKIQSASGEELLQTGQVTRMIRYINLHLTELKGIENLEQNFYLSKSQLNRIFQRETGTTIWKYVQIKRLFLAREMLQSGTMPSEVFSSCGYRDYSTFYRGYRKQFGKTPQEDCLETDRKCSQTMDRVSMI